MLFSFCIKAGYAYPVVFRAIRPPTTYETIRGANDLPKNTYTPSYKEKGRPEVNEHLLVCAKG